MNHIADIVNLERLTQEQADARLCIDGDYGTLRTWMDGCRHPVTLEPTFAVDVVYRDDQANTQQHFHQRGLRAPTVASICACICFGETNVTADLVDRINEKFRLIAFSA